MSQYCWEIDPKSAPIDPSGGLHTPTQRMVRLLSDRHHHRQRPAADFAGLGNPHIWSMIYKTDRFGSGHFVPKIVRVWRRITHGKFGQQHWGSSN